MFSCLTGFTSYSRHSKEQKSYLKEILVLGILPLPKHVIWYKTFFEIADTSDCSIATFMFSIQVLTHLVTVMCSRPVQSNPASPWTNTDSQTVWAAGLVCGSQRLRSVWGQGSVLGDLNRSQEETSYKAFMLAIMWNLICSISQVSQCFLIFFRLYILDLSQIHSPRL